jgi:hypothetical protein
MSSEIDQQIVDLLKTYSNQKFTFYQAKEKLIRAGYKEEDIKRTADIYQYGAIPKPADPAIADYEKDPQDTEKVAQEILEDQKKERERQAIADGLAEQLSPDLQSDIKYQNNYLYDIGMSWWTWLAIELVTAGIIYWFHLPQACYSVIVVTLVIVFARKRA